MKFRFGVDSLLRTYSHGVFPMATDRNSDDVLWVRPRRRAVIPLDDRFHISRSLRKELKKDWWHVTYSTHFADVVRQCATVHRGRDQDKTWLSRRIEAFANELHANGFAHSVEIHDATGMVGGLYGVAIGGVFVGESMFSYRANASKLATVMLVTRLRERGFVLLDAQYENEYLKQFGTYLVTDAEFEQLLSEATKVPAQFLVP